MSDDLELANASIRRGARLSQILFPGFALLASVYMTKFAVEVDAVVLAVLVIVIAFATTAVIVVQARRLGSFQLTAEGVHTPDGQLLPWNAITRATTDRGSLALYDRAGDETRVAITLAIPQSRVLAAIRARLPAGVQLETKW